MPGKPDANEVLGLPPAVRAEIWAQTIGCIEQYLNQVEHFRVSPESLDPEPLRRRLAEFTFDVPGDPFEAIAFAADGLSRHQVHTSHPRYFGLFNPASTTLGIAADALVAAFNPQMAAWSHNPFAAETERHLVRSFGRLFGYREVLEGVFTTGGAEANLTGLLCALVRQFPEFCQHGLQALPGKPILYVSGHAHDSLLKAARCCGLGSSAVRQVPVGPGLNMNLAALQDAIQADRAAGYLPFLVVATAGTTSTGAFDDIDAIVTICRRENLWCHVDAAWGGAAALLPEWKHCLRGIERAHSITFDAHKFLSVPMGGGMFLTQDPTILQDTFQIRTDYMPAPVGHSGTLDPYASSIQWSRRFIGLKLFLSLATAGWEGYTRVVRHQTEMGELLRARLIEDGWEVVNHTPLPLVCFRDPQIECEATLARIMEKAVGSGQVWISSVRIPHLTLRACVTSYRTMPDDIEALVVTLSNARQEVLGG